MAASKNPQIDYRVHSCVRSDFPATAEIAGRPTQVKVPGLVVELVTADGSMSHTLRFAPEDIEATEALFEIDSAITATFTRS